jgi:hypothetical protein
MSGGTENRTTILPVADSGSLGGFMPPDYDFSAAVPTPKQIGVKKDDTLESVINAVKGVAYYSDVIGFGQSGNILTRGMDFAPLGINYFMGSGLTCTNGAPMSMYINGIPKGDGFGQTVKDAMADMGLPGLRGLAPGMLEDTQSALNAKPILQAAFGNSYPVCEQVTLPVGDARGQIRDPKSGTLWIQGKVNTSSGIPTQTQWIQKVVNGNPVFASSDEADATPKITGKVKKEGFTDSDGNRYMSLAVAGLLFGMAYMIQSKVLK